MPLNKEDLKNLKEDLRKKEKDLKGRLKNEEKSPEFGSDIDSFDEEADEVEEYSNQLGIQEALKVELEEIKRALNKIEKGEFGYCEKCKKEISFNLLKIDPESRLCKECKLAVNKSKGK